MSTVQFPIEYVESYGKPFAMPQAVVVHSRRADDVGRWYRQFGFEVFRQRTDDGQTYLTARCHGLLLKILTAGMSRESENTTFYFVVDDFEAALGAVAALKATIMTAPLLSFGRRRIVLADPDGRRVVLTERASSGAMAVTDGQTLNEVHEVRPSEPVIPEDAEFERAFAAVRRGGKAALLALAVHIVIASVIIVLVLRAMFDGRAQNPGWLPAEIEKIPVGAALIIGTLFTFAALIVSAWHRTKRVNYAGLWLVIILDGLNIAASIVGILGPPREWSTALSTINHVVLFAPVLYFHFLTEFFKAANEESAAGQMNATMYINFAFALSIVGMTLRSFLPQPLPESPLLLFTFGVLTIVACIATVLALFRVATLRGEERGERRG